MDMQQRVMFQKIYESPDRDNDRRDPDNTCWRHWLTNGGAITVLHRLTGFGWWDVETGYRSPCGQFWLASGNCDIREYLHQFDSEDGMIAWVIRNANNCTGGHHATPKNGAWTVTPPRLLANIGAAP